VSNLQLNGSRWVGAGGPAYYLQAADERVIAILYWSPADVTVDSGDELGVTEPGWSVVFTDNGDCVGLPNGVPITDLSDEESVEAINATVEAATRFVERDGH
jgi:hypothetical protein